MENSDNHQTSARFVRVLSVLLPAPFFMALAFNQFATIAVLAGLVLALVTATVALIHIYRIGNLSGGRPSVGMKLLLFCISIAPAIWMIYISLLN